MKEIKYNRGELFRSLAVVLFLGIPISLTVLHLYVSYDLDVIGLSEFGLLLPCVLFAILVLGTVGYSLRLLHLPFAVKLENEVLEFSGQALRTVRLEDLDFISYDEDFRGNHNAFQVLLGFSDDVSETLPQKVQKKLLETQAGQKMLVLNFSTLDHNSWEAFWTEAVFPEESKFIDSILLDNRGLLATYKAKIVGRDVRLGKLAAFWTVVITTIFCLKMLHLDELIKFDLFH